MEKIVVRYFKFNTFSLSLSLSLSLKCDIMFVMFNIIFFNKILSHPYSMKASKNSQNISVRKMNFQNTHLSILNENRNFFNTSILSPSLSLPSSKKPISILKFSLSNLCSLNPNPKRKLSTLPLRQSRVRGRNKKSESSLFFISLN